MSMMVVDPYRFGAPMPTPPTLHAIGTVSSNAFSTTVVVPSSVENDIAILIVMTGNQAPGTDPTIAGWTQIYTATGIGTAGAAGSVALNVYWARADSSNNFPSGSIGDSGSVNIGAALVFRGCRTTGSPIDVSSGSTQTTSTSVSFPSVTTTAAARMIVNVAALGGPDTTLDNSNVSSLANANLASITQAIDALRASGTGGGLVASYGVKTAPGSVGNTTATLGTAANQELCTLALIPA